MSPFAVRDVLTMFKLVIYTVPMLQLYYNPVTIRLRLLSFSSIFYTNAGRVRHDRPWSSGRSRRRVERQFSGGGKRSVDGQGDDIALCGRFCQPRGERRKARDAYCNRAGQAAGTAADRGLARPDAAGQLLHDQPMDPVMASGIRRVRSRTGISRSLQEHIALRCDD
jgi:hypothetical protein